MPRIGLPLINVLRLKGAPILRQLHLEERLLRTSTDNWCIINDGTIDPTIVMGRLFGAEIHVSKLTPEFVVHMMNMYARKPKELIDIESVLRDDIPVIRRFTGGGTVIVDQGTLFVTFICNKGAVPDLQAYPHPIMSWSSLIYKEVFRGIGDFSLRENDYVLGNHKFGGNAQSITKSRWIHHTSFLWDFRTSNMDYLKLPRRAPQYRQARDHLEFICCLKDYISRSDFIDKTIDAVGSHFALKSLEMEAVETPSSSRFAPSSRFLMRDELEDMIPMSSGANANTALAGQI